LLARLLLNSDVILRGATLARTYEQAVLSPIFDFQSRRSSCVD
jgi:hypothetical protein